MKAPIDLNDYAQCVVIKTNTVFVYCVECNAWHQAMVHAMCGVIFRQSGARQVEDADRITYHCGNCSEDVGYLIQAEHEAVLRRLYP